VNSLPAAPGLRSSRSPADGSRGMAQPTAFGLYAPKQEKTSIPGGL